MDASRDGPATTRPEGDSHAKTPLGSNSAFAEATRRKEAGNAAFRAGRYRVAASEYDAALAIMRAGGATTTTTSMHGEDEDEGDEGDEEIEVVLGGRDAAVCYANRAAARLMRAAEGKDAIAHARGPSSKDAIAHARETRLALADCRAALVADAGFDRARLRAGTCLMRLGFFAAAERVLARSVSAEARGLAKDASRARATVEELRGGALDRLRAATMTGAARGAVAAKRRAALLAEGAGWAKARSVSAEAANASDSDASIAAFFSIASRARRVADLAPHCAAAAEASARASMFAGDFADARPRSRIARESEGRGTKTVPRRGARCVARRVASP